MNEWEGQMTIAKTKRLWTIFLLSAFSLLLTPFAGAEEGGAVSYPEGVETVMPAVAPTPKVLVMQEFTLFYSASRFNDSHGDSLIPNFRLTEFANCVKFKYNWGIKALGGHLMSGVGVVQAYAQVEESVTAEEIAAGTVQSQAKTNLANQDLEPLFVVYNKGPLYWQYGMDIWTPGPSYKQNDIVNVGQHYWEFEPVFAVTWLPNKGTTELSSRVHYALATTNPDNNYHSGNYVSIEFNATQNVSKKLALGFQGYLLKQVRDDTIHGIKVGDGNRTQALGLGPQIRYAIGNGAIAFKYYHDTNARYHVVSNGFWFELGIPIHKGKL
jgi:hypothetical protein